MKKILNCLSFAAVFSMSFSITPVLAMTSSSVDDATSAPQKFKDPAVKQNKRILKGLAKDIAQFPTLSEDSQETVFKQVAEHFAQPEFTTGAVTGKTLKVLNALTCQLDEIKNKEMQQATAQLIITMLAQVQDETRLNKKHDIARLVESKADALGLDVIVDLSQFSQQEAGVISGKIPTDAILEQCRNIVNGKCAQTNRDKNSKLLKRLSLYVESLTGNENIDDILSIVTNALATRQNDHLIDMTKILKVAGALVGKFELLSANQQAQLIQLIHDANVVETDNAMFIQKAKMLQELIGLKTK